MSKETISYKMRICVSVWNKIKALAEKQDRTIQGTIRFILNEHFEKRKGK